MVVKTRFKIEKKHMYYLITFIAVFIGITYAIAQASAPNPGHAADEIGEGTIAGALTISGGNVGIGTTSPDAKLDVSGGVIRALATAAPAAGLGTGMEMFFDSNGPEGRLISLDRAGTGTYKPIRFGASTYQFDVSATAKMVLDANGNVGIGTTSPQVRLEVVSTGFHNTRFTNTLPGGNSWDLAIGDNGLGIPGIFSIGYIGASGSGIGGGPHYSVLALSPSGNVGIGTTEPGDKLSVNGDISASGNIKLTCTKVTAQCTLPTTAGGYCSATATCPSGYYIVSGGFGVGKCGHGDEYEVEQSYPLSSTQWFADFSNAGTCTVDRVQTTYAVCCKTASY